MGRTVFSWEAKKEEFPGGITKMIPGNSFPQICFVAVMEFVEIEGGRQGHGGICDQGTVDEYIPFVVAN